MKVLILFVSLCALAVRLPAAEIRVAAASDLKFALDEMVGEFQAAHPSTIVNVTYGSSGNFYTQLQNNAPFDLYFSADIQYPRKLAAADVALEKNVFRYAIGRLVVWLPKQSALDLEKGGLRALLDPSVKKIAIANPKHAPYGSAAVAALKTLGVYEEAEPKLVYGENIAQAAQFVQSGAAEVGLIALSLALAPEMRAAGRYWEIPRVAYPALEQGGVILKSSRDPVTARLFRDFLLGENGRAVLQRYGFSLPEN